MAYNPVTRAIGGTTTNTNNLTVPGAGQGD